MMDQAQPLPISTSITPQPSGPNLKTPLLIAAGALIFTAGVGAGILAVKYISPQSTALSTPAPSPISQATPTPDLNREPTNSAATANWKTYTNSKYSFSFKHPDLDDKCCGLAGAVVGNPASIVTLADKTTVIPNTDAPFDGISVYAISNGENLSLDQYVEKEKLALYEQFKIMSDPNQPHQGRVSEALIAGQRAIVLNNYSWDGITRTYFVHPNKRYPQYIIEISKKEKAPSHFSAFDQILSTFRFVE